MEQVFISYSRKDYLDENNQVVPGNIVSRIKDALTQEGISYWFDEEGITHGDTFAQVIVKHIRNSQVFLFVSSENSNNSEWTSREIAAAFQWKKRIIPFRYDSAPYNDTVMLYLAPLDFVEYYKNPDKAIPNLIKAIKAHLDAIKEEEARKLREQEEKKRREEQQKLKAEQLRQIREQKLALDAKRVGVSERLAQAKKDVEALDAEILGIDASLEMLRKEEIQLMGIPEQPVPSKEAKQKKAEKKNPQPVTVTPPLLDSGGNIFARIGRDFSYHWKTNPMVVNIWAVLSLCALAYLAYRFSGISLKHLMNVVRPKKTWTLLTGEYLIVIGSVFLGIWAVFRLYRKDALAYLYLMLPPVALSIILNVMGHGSNFAKVFKGDYLLISYICGAIGILGLLLLPQKKNGVFFAKSIHLRLKETFKDWSKPAVWGAALLLLVVLAGIVYYFIKH